MTRCLFNNKPTQQGRESGQWENMQEVDPKQKRNPRTCPPPADTKIILHGSDCWGDWRIAGYRKDYKKKQHFKTLVDGSTYYRFVDYSGCIVGVVEFWSYE